MGAYLAECRDVLGVLPTVLMLSDTQHDMHDAPPDAVRILKPFTCAELLLAVDDALAIGASTMIE